MGADEPVVAAAEPLFSLVYTSMAVTAFTDDELSALLEESRRANQEAGITGLLLYRDGRFVQFLEGPQSRVQDTYARIAADRRHTRVRILIDGHPAGRAFSEWTMGYEPLRTPDGPAPEGFRDSFEDVERAESDDAVIRALQELSIWFRHRSQRSL